MSEKALLPLMDVVDFSSGVIKGAGAPMERRLSDMPGYYFDQNAVKEQLEENPVLYRVYAMEHYGEEQGLQIATSIIEPGTVGKEYFMTKGHFHEVANAPEVYTTLSGTGILLMETEEGDTHVQYMERGTVHYIPGKWAHRTINTGDTPLVLFAVWPANAGHDYGSIKDSGFVKLVIKGKNGPEIIQNPKKV